MNNPEDTIDLVAAAFIRANILRRSSTDIRGLHECMAVAEILVKGAIWQMIKNVNHMQKAIGWAFDNVLMPPRVVFDKEFVEVPSLAQPEFGTTEVPFELAMEVMEIHTAQM